MQEQNKKNQLIKAKEVKAEISPIREEVEEFVSEMKDKVSNMKFKHAESADILNHLFEQFENEVKDVLGEGEQSK
jgi:hypothetical protein